jgi:hypothetical protein
MITFTGLDLEFVPTQILQAEAGQLPVNTHEAWEVPDEHRPLHDDDDDSNEDENHEANAHEPRDGAGHDYQGLVNNEDRSHQAINVSGNDSSDEHRDSSRPAITLGSGAANGAVDSVNVSANDPSDGHRDSSHPMITLGSGAANGVDVPGNNLLDVHRDSSDPVITLGNGTNGDVDVSANDPSNGHSDSSNPVLTLGGGADAFVWNDTFNQGHANPVITLGAVDGVNAWDNDPSSRHSDSSNLVLTLDGGADVFVWSDTFNQGDGANPVITLGAVDGVNALDSDPSNKHSDSSNPMLTLGGGADVFVWSDTFNQGDGANHAPADEGLWSLLSASLDLPLVQEGDVHCDGNLPYMTPNGINLVTLMAPSVDHWFL